MLKAIIISRYDKSWCDSSRLVPRDIRKRRNYWKEKCLSSANAHCFDQKRVLSIYLSYLILWMGSKLSTLTTSLRFWTTNANRHKSWSKLTRKFLTNGYISSTDFPGSRPWRYHIKFIRSTNLSKNWLNLL